MYAVPENKYYEWMVEPKTAYILHAFQLHQAVHALKEYLSQVENGATINWQQYTALKSSAVAFIAAEILLVYFCGLIQ